MMEPKDDQSRPAFDPLTGAWDQARGPAGGMLSQEVTERLLALNRRFYQRFADDFDATRGPHQAGLSRLVRALDLRPGSILLDAGCGNGRLAQLLDDLQLPLHYVGVDASSGLLAAAKRNTANLAFLQVDLLELDVTKGGWWTHLPAERFDVVALLAVLHHLPGQHLRATLLRSIKPLMAPGGVLAVSTWQFLNSPRLRRKIVPWSILGLDQSALEPGDYLLDWRRGGTGLRYCHLIDEGALVDLADASGWRLRESFFADGHEGNLNLFALLTLPGDETV